MSGKLNRHLRNVLITVATGLTLTACGTTQMNMIEVQTATAKTLGLASSDEITISNVQYGEKNSLGGQKVSYDVGQDRKAADQAGLRAGLAASSNPRDHALVAHLHAPD